MEGLLISRRLVSAAFGILAYKFHFLRKGLLINIDDMTCVYSTNDGFSFENTSGLTLKSSVSSNKQSYSAHFKAHESAAKRFRGIKGRYANLMVDNSQMGPIWLQFLGLSAEELPPNAIWCSRYQITGPDCRWIY